jgi:alpha-L-rhamnosidase
VPDEHRDAAFAAVVENIERQGHLDTGILGAKYVLRVLAQGGRSDLAFRLVTRPEPPSWAWWIGQGATTLWEDWKGEGSLNHIMFGDVSNWLFQWIAGIGLDEDAPGFRHVRIRPQPVGGLTWARAHHDSPQGRIVSNWALEGDAFRLQVTVPPGAAATVWVPASAPAQVREGAHPADRAPGVRLVRQEPDRAVFAVGSGTYTFLASRWHESQTEKGLDKTTTK